MRVLVLNGPNLGSLGHRQPELYGSASLGDIETSLRREAAAMGTELRFEQSNHEGTLIDVIESENGSSGAIVINPGGLAHTSVALADAVRAFRGPVVEVHITNILAREEYRRLSHVAAAATAVILGAGVHGYILGLRAAIELAGDTTLETTG